MHHHQVVRNESSAITTSSPSSEIDDEEEEEEMDEEQTNNHHEEEVDEEAEGDDEEDDEEDEENESRPSKHQLIRPVATSVSSTTATALAAYQQHQSIYQQNCLAAAQMAQLIAAGVNPQSIQTQQTVASQPTANIEKENIPICKFCSKQFANFSNLNHHISAIHLNQSKWVCSQCGKICSSKSNLKVHLRVHLRVKPYHCRWCSYSCMHHSSIRDHLAKVHPDKVHTPLQPGYMFNSQAVPEPEVFNSKGFNPNTFASEKNAADAAAAAAAATATPTSQQQFKRSPSIDAGVNEQMSPDRQIRLHKKQKVLYHVVYRLF